jgi:uncharacterized phage infection (PIP) family protein YhgE
MSSNAIDCSSIEQRIDEYNLYISTTQDQVNKLDPGDPDVQNKRDALTRKLDNLHEQQGLLQRALEDCQQGKGTNFPSIDLVSDYDTI